ncbi:MAG: hypothetical protein JWO67_2889 [Streptosporangiaceae bacterium]|nr:hypothetical protein [Streptosporangiaceae bacterium]
MLPAAGGSFEPKEIRVHDREPRCRMLDRHRNPCPNPAMDPDPKAIQICVSHAAAVIELINDPDRPAVHDYGRRGVL